MKTNSHNTPELSDIDLLNSLIPNMIDNQHQIIDLIKNKDINPNQTVKFYGQETSLIALATKKYSTELINVILNHKNFDPNQTVKSYGEEYSLIAFMTENFFIESIDAILNHNNFDPNQTVIKPYGEEISLIALIREEYPTKSIDSILNHKNFDPNQTVKSYGQETSLISFAIQNYDTEVRDAILNHKKFDPNQTVKSYGQETSLISFAIKNRSTKVIDVILKHDDFDPNQKILDNGLEYSFIEYLISKQDLGNLELMLKKENFNINKKDVSKNRLIDLVNESPSNSKNSIIELLRKYGSVEPKKPLSSVELSKKIIFQDNIAPDYDLNNHTATEEILSKLKDDVKLDENSYENIIKDFKQRNQSYMGEKAEWSEDINTVEKVIDELSEIKTELVDNGLNQGWDFREVLAKVITLHEGDSNDEYTLIHAISKMNACRLSKLMHLIANVQYKLKDSNHSLDYASKSFEDLQGYLSNVLVKIKERLVEDSKSDMAVAKWLYDTLDQKNVDDAEDWNYLTSVVRGAFNEVMMSEPGYDRSSNYFTDGVEVIMHRLKEKFTKGAGDKVDANLKEWEQVLVKGKIGFVVKYFGEILNDPSKMDDIISEMQSNAELNFGYLNFVPRELLQEYVNKIRIGHSEKDAKEFIELLTEHSYIDSEVLESLVISAGDIYEHHQPMLSGVVNNCTITSSAEEEVVNNSTITSSEAIDQVVILSEANSNNDIELSGNTSSSSSIEF